MKHGRLEFWARWLFMVLTKERGICHGSTGPIRCARAEDLGLGNVRV